MQHKLIEHFSRIMPLSDEEANAIIDSMCIRTYKKGTVLLREGQISTECYFVVEGCVRQYYIIDGEERTNNFFTEEQWVVSTQSFLHKRPADHYFACCEETTLVVGNSKKEQDLYSKFAKFETIARIVIEMALGEQQEMTASYLKDTPEQRYLKLLQARPDLLQRIPQYQLASYIGVKPESLSRIKKRIASRSYTTAVP